MKKRSCERFSIPGVVLYYKNKPRFFGKGTYSEDYYPVINLSRGGANFLCDQRLKTGTALLIKVTIPGMETEPEILASVRWISKNREQSYRYQTGVAFSSYGNNKNENSREILSLLKTLESRSEKAE